MSTHEGTLLSGQITCTCGWASKHSAVATDAIAEWEEHRVTARSQSVNTDDEWAPDDDPVVSGEAVFTDYPGRIQLDPVTGEFSSPDHDEPALTIATLLDEHVEWWDEDCAEHGGCSCRTPITGITPGRVAESDYAYEGETSDNMPSRLAWRAHLVQVLTDALT